MRDLLLDGRLITDDAPCYVVVEIGNTHQGSVDRATELIHVAALCGADAVKLQKKDLRGLYTSAVAARPYTGFGPTYGAHKAALELSLSDLARLQQVARQAGILLFATPFDEASADDLAALGMAVFKLHSGALTDAPLLEHVARFGRPVILSTGGGTEADIDRAVAIVQEHAPLALLHCTAEYPVASPSHLNLRYIARLRERYPDLVIGWSAHDTSPNTSGIAHALVAYGYGARILEKHFTLDHELPGTDHAFSLEPSGLRKLVQDLRQAHAVSGDGVKVFYPEERAAMGKLRRTETAEGWRIAG